MSFKKDFLWGAASAAFQIEGAFDADGKGASIWDILSKKPGRIRYGETGDVACDHYNRFRSDVQLMKELGLKSYRFSVSWPRVIPNGVGNVNEAGLQFYSDLVDELIAADIEPLLTLYHWDLPYELYLKGGWKNEDISDWFAQYVQVMVDCLGDRVKYWLTFNEPQMFVGLGYKLAIHAPFEQVSDDEIMQITKNILLSHGKAVKVIRDRLGNSVKVGFAPTGDVYLPEDETEVEVQRARKKSFSLDKYATSNVWWADPIFFGKVPEGAVEKFGNKLYSLTDEEWKIVSQSLDFYAYNVYQGTNIMPPPLDKYSLYGYQGCPKTSFGWDVTPSVLYWSSKFLYERYSLPVLITENGYSSIDRVSLDGKVHDPNRIDYTHRYLRELKRVVDEGVEVLGYTHWSLLDNMEWASGYDVRFGLIYVDYRTQQRIIKDSGYWYRDMINSNGENL